MSEGGKRKLDEGETQGKKVKIDENDIDFLIGDLFKEEAQLVLTRLLRLPDLEEHIRRHIEIIRSARNKVSEEQIKKQFAQIQQLRALQEQAFAASGTFHPGAGMPGLGSSGGATLDPSILRSIKTKIRDSFKKSQVRKGEFYRVEESSVQYELNNAKEKSLKGSIRLPLEILQAVTEEFLERSSQINEENVDNHSSVLEIIGKTWIEVFLSENPDGTSELTDDERDVWSEKLRSWNKSPEEESVLNVARWAARYGWQDSLLRKMMAGEIANDPNSPTPAFKEPSRLTQERLSILERDKLFNEGLNLSKGLLLHFQAARFLVKLNRTQEAQEAAMQLTNATEISAIAQAARPVDVDVAFTLAIQSISVHDGSKVTEMSNWITDLAISEKRLEKLVEQVSQMVKNKNTQFRIIKLLKSKEQIKTAIQLAEHTIKPYTREQLLALWTEWHPTPLNSKPDEVIIAPPTTRKQLLASVSGADVPSDLGQFIWETAYESDTKPESTSHFQDEIVPIILEYVSDASQLIALMNTVDAIGKNSCVQTVLKVGKVTLDKVNDQEKFDQEFKREAAIEKYNYDREKEVADSLGKIIPSFIQKPVDHPQYDFESYRLQICRSMLNSVFNIKKFYEDLIDPNLLALSKVTEEERNAKILEYETTLGNLVELSISKISNATSLLSIANDVSARQEYRLALTIGQRAFTQVQILDKERQIRDAWVAEYRQLEAEQRVLSTQRLSLSTEKLEKFKKLSLDFALLTLQPLYLKNATEQSIQALYQQIANFNVEAALKSKSSTIIERRLKPEEIFEIVEKSLQFVESPQGLGNLVRLSQNWNEYLLVQKIGKHALTIIASLKEKLMQRTVIQKEIEIINTETQNLTICKKELDVPQARLEELNNKLKSLPVAQFYELRLCDEYDNLFIGVIQDMITSALNEKVSLETQLRSNPQAQNISEEAWIEKEKALKVSLKEAINRLESVFNECLPQIENPDQILAFSRTLSTHGQIELSIKAAEFSQVQSKKLIDNRKTIWEEEKDLNELRIELNELLSQKPPQYFPQDKSDHFRQLSLRSAILDVDSSFKRKSIAQFNSNIYLSANQMISIVSNKEQEIIRQINAIVNEILNPIPSSLSFGQQQEAIEAAAKAALASKKQKKKELDKELPLIANEKRRLISQALQTITFDDNSLIQILSQITLTDVESVELLIKSAPAVFDSIELHNQERIRFSANNEKVSLLQEESNLLERYRKKLPEDKAKELATLLREIERWNFFGSRYTSDQFVNFSHSLSNSSLNSLVQARNRVEGIIQKIELDEKYLNLDPDLLSPENDIKYLKEFSQTIFKNIELFLNLVLSKINNPHDLLVESHSIKQFLHLLYKTLRKALDLTKHVDTIFDGRIATLEELKKLEEEAASLSDVNKQLKKEQQDRLTELIHQRFVWNQEPSFTRNSPEVRDKLKYDILNFAESSILYQRNSLQSKLKNLEEEKLTLSANSDPMQVDGAPKTRTLAVVNKEIDDMKKEIQKIRDELVRVTKEFVNDLTDPQHILDATNNLLSNSEHELLLDIARYGIDLTLKLDAERQRQLEGFKKYYYLLVESYEKKKNNNLLHNKRATLLKTIQDEVSKYQPIRYGLRKTGGAGRNKASFNYPTKEELDFASSLAESKDVKFNEEPKDLSNALYSTTLSGIIAQLSQLMVNSVLTSISEFEAEITELEQKGLKDPEKEDSPEIVQKRKQLEAKLLDTCLYVFSMVEDFTVNEKIFGTVRDEEQYSSLHTIAKKVCEQIKPLRSIAVENDLIRIEMKKLEQQQAQLASVRSSLSEQEELRLVELQFDQKLRQIQPNFLIMNKQQYDNNIYRILDSLVSVTYEKKKEIETKFNDMINAPRLVRGASMTEEQIKEKSTKEINVIEKDVDSALDLCIQFIIELQHFVSFVVKANGEHRDFVRVIRLGTRAQEMLKEQLEIQEKYDSLTKKRLELEEKQISGAPPSDELLDVRTQLEELEPKLNHSTNQLRHWILEVAGYMIDAARIEKKDHIVLEQAILVFKMTMTHEKFEEVRNLTDPKDWDKVRKDLLNYVAKHDTTLPGSPITLKTQIELLLRESLCSEAIDIFPDPGIELHEISSRIEILELLWFEVERQKPAALDRILPIIEKYAKKEFQQFKITTLDRLFDFVQNKFPDFIVVIYSRGSEILLGNMTATKYNVYTQFLRTLKKRLTVDMQRPKDWDDFINKIKKENARKKKLLQMINIDEI